MPYYCYVLENGETVERHFPMGGAPTKIKVCGEIARRNRAAEGVRGNVCHHIAPCRKNRGWPMEPCFASGVHASQAQELRDFYKKHGMNVEVNNDGDPIYESAVQRKKALQLRGMHDRASYD